MIHTFFVPHNPLMISKIGKEYSQNVSVSINGLKKIRQTIYNLNPDKILIITPSAGGFNDISINQNEEYAINFKEFGDLSMQFNVLGDLDVSTRLRDFLLSNNFDIRLFSDSEVNYKAFVPLYYLNQYHIDSRGFEKKMVHKTNIENEFIIIHCSNKDPNYHLKFGELLNNFLVQENQEIVVIACGDLIENFDETNKDEVLKIADDIVKYLRNDYQALLNYKSEKFNSPFLKIFPTIIPLASKLKPKIFSIDKKFKGVYLSCGFE